MPIVFIAGRASEAYPAEFAELVNDAVRARFPDLDGEAPEAYRSDEIDPQGWIALQQRAKRALGETAPHLTSVEPYQAAYVPQQLESVQHVTIPNAADPLQIGSIPRLIDELTRLAEKESLPTDDVELMNLAAEYLEDEDPDRDLDIQTFIQLLLSAKQAGARRQALWIVS